MNKTLSMSPRKTRRKKRLNTEVILSLIHI